MKIAKAQINHSPLQINQMKQNVDRCDPKLPVNINSKVVRVFLFVLAFILIVINNMYEIISLTLPSILYVASNNRF